MARFKTSLEKMLAANIRQMNKFVEFAENEALKSVEKDAEKVVEIEKDRLYSGKTYTGESIKPEYAPRTVQIKTLKGQPTDRVTTRDTGYFHSRLELQVSKSLVTFTSDDGVQIYLEKKYDNLMGLSEESKELMITDIINRVNPKLFKKLLQPRYL